MKIWNQIFPLLAIVKLVIKGDECPEDFLQNGDFCYRFFNDAKSWHEAEAFCTQIKTTDGISAHLASIHDETENEFISSLTAEGTGKVSHATGPETWIGLFKIDQSRFAWSDNTPIDYERWDPGEPNSVGDACANTNQAGRRSNWDDTGCTGHRPFLCKIPIPATGLLDATFWSNYAGSMYRFYCQKSTWEEANTICASETAHLVIIDDPEENDFVSTLTASSTIKDGPPTWIGLKAKPILKFEWSDGSDYAGVYSNRCCVHTNGRRSRGEWINGDCSIKLAFVCEKNE